MDPKAFLDFAHELTKRTDEAALRTCVSRSYYALFNSMAQFIEEHIGRLSHSAADHDKVVFYFNNCSVADITEVASALNDLRSDRNRADYQLDEIQFCNQPMVAFLYKKAEIAYNKFAKLVNSSGRRRQIIQQIEEYKKKTNS